jgi:tRNA(Arg) A34 adenosine deaminase TadA
MCLGAIYWARIRVFYFAGNQECAARGEFDDSFIYSELNKAVEARTIPGHRLLAEEGLRPFEEWLRAQNRVRY